jgi:hypothetical protein
VDTVPEAGLGSTPLEMFPLEQEMFCLKENLSTGHQRLNPDRACKRGNVTTGG